MLVKSHKVQLEAMRSSTQSYSERDFEGKTSMIETVAEGKKAGSEVLSKKKNMLEQCFRGLSGLKARFSSDFERSVASKEKEACSSIDFERSVAFRRYRKQSRAVISSAQRPKSKLEK